MKYIYLFFLIFLVAGAKAQNISDTLRLQKRFLGYTFTHMGETVKVKKVMQLMECNELALQDFAASREAQVFGHVFTIIGTGLFIYPFVNVALGHDPDYGPAFAGVCFAGISVPIFRSAHKKAISALIKYNEGLASFKEATGRGGFYFGNSTTGMGIAYKF